MHGFDRDAYADVGKKVFAEFTDAASALTTAPDVAEAVWYAVTDPSARTRRRGPLRRVER